MNTGLDWGGRLARYREITGYPQSLFVDGTGRLNGIWIMGNNYRVRSRYYGGYPYGYLKRVRALFPEFLAGETLHLFSGAGDFADFPGDSVDINSNNRPTYVDDAQTLLAVPVERYKIVLADPQYSVEDAEHYGTAMVDRRKVFRALAGRLGDNALVVWMDQVLPMYSKRDWELVGCIGLVKSTNHRFRVVTIFRRRRRVARALVEQ